jgi:hypothetical protein
VLKYVTVTLHLSCLLYVMHCPLYFHVFIHLHLASYLGTLDEPCEGHDVGAESEDGRTLECMPRVEMFPSRRCKLTELTCVGSRQASEYFKSSMSLQNFNLNPLWLMH